MIRNDKDGCVMQFDTSSHSANAFICLSQTQTSCLIVQLVDQQSLWITWWPTSVIL